MMRFHTKVRMIRPRLPTPINCSLCVFIGSLSKANRKQLLMCVCVVIVFDAVCVLSVSTICVLYIDFCFYALDSPLNCVDDIQNHFEYIISVH